jgi:hypothetical protein
MTLRLMIKQDFLLNGLSYPKSFTCYTIDGKETIFWAKSKMPNDRFNALFKCGKNTDDFWESKWIAEIEHEGLYDDGTPKNPFVIDIREV